MSCCTNTYNLGCFNNCSIIAVGLCLTSGTYNGVFTYGNISTTITVTAIENEPFLFDLSLLNENATFTLAIYDENGNQITLTIDSVDYDCFKVKTQVDSVKVTQGTIIGCTPMCKEIYDPNDENTAVLFTVAVDGTTITGDGTVGNPLIAIGGGGGGGIESIVAGDNITVDNTDPLNPIVSASGGGSSNGIDTISITYADFYNAITNSQLVGGMTYVIKDFQTVYDQMDFDNTGALKSTLTTKTGAIEQIWVLALSSNQIADRAYSRTYPKDEIQYDWTYNATLVNGAPAKGRISERIDENNNRTDYDHREIKFIRYDDGAGNFTVINDNGNASAEFLTFVQNFTGGVVKDNWLGDYYSIGQFFGKEYGNNVFTGGFVVSNKTSSLFFTNTFSGYVNNNTFSGDVNTNTFSGKVNVNTFSGAVNNNTFSGEVNNNTFSGEVNNNTFSGYVNNNTFSGEVNTNTFSGEVNVNTFSGEVNVNTFSGYVNKNTFSGYVNNNTFRGEVNVNTFSGYVNNNTFTHTNPLQYCTIASDLANKTIDETTYPILFGNALKKEILKASNGNDYIKTFDGTIDQYILIP